MGLQLFAEEDQVYVACDDCRRAFPSLGPLDCGPEEVRLLEIDLYSAESCELCEVVWAVNDQVLTVQRNVQQGTPNVQFPMGGGSVRL